MTLDPSNSPLFGMVTRANDRSAAPDPVESPGPQIEATSVLNVAIRGGEHLRLSHVIMDLDTVLTPQAAVAPDVRQRIDEVAELLQVHLISTDPAILERTATWLGVQRRTVGSSKEKQRFLSGLSSERCVAIGAGVSDVAMLRDAGLGIAVQGRATSAAAFVAADIVCPSLNDALDVLIDHRTAAAVLGR